MNKLSLIALLSNTSDVTRFSIRQADDDADNLIATRAIQIHKNSERYGNYIDLPVLLIALREKATNLIFLPPRVKNKWDKRLSVILLYSEAPRRYRYAVHSSHYM